MSRHHIIRFVLLAAFVLLEAGLLRAQYIEPPLSGATLDEVVDLVGAQYWRELPRDSVRELVRYGGLQSLDPYSRVFSPTDWTDMRHNIAGHFGGIGVMLEEDSVRNEIRVKGVLRSSPALAAGIQSGDVLAEIEGQPIGDRGIDDIVGLMRGKVGDTLRIAVRRTSHSSPLRFSIARDVIHTPSIRGWSRDETGAWQYFLEGTDGLAYLRITQFTENTVSEFNAALAVIERSSARGLVLDLRENIGGLFMAAIGVADRLLDSGLLVTVRGRIAPDTAHIAERGKATAVPIAMLINGFTASSGEILASALQDNRRVTTIGARSYGKGLVQKLYGLADSVSGVMLTTAAYIRPSGRPIERHLAGADTAAGGVWPDPGMTVPDKDEQSAAEITRLLETDATANFAQVKIAGIPPAEDRALALACKVLLQQIKQ